MRANVRPFVREYKSRSFKTTLQSLEKHSVSGPDAQALGRPESRSLTSDLVIATRRNDAVQKEAEAIFRQGVFARPSSDANDDDRNDTLFTGRILPCLLQEPSSVGSENDGKASNTRRGNGPSSTTRRQKPRLKQSREAHPPVSSSRNQLTPWSPSVSDEFVALSDLEILSLIERAKTELACRKEAGKERLRAEIEAKLANAGLDIGDLFESERKITRGGSKSKESDSPSGVAAKYKNHATGETWSGRGRSPKWVTAILQEREWTIDEFKQSDEFLIA
jgi:DNA-binding protein H-NS